MELFLEWDRWILYAINRGLKNPLFDWLMPILSDFEFMAFPLAALLAYSIWKGTWRTRWAFLLIAVCFAVTDPLTSRILKPLFERPRPYNALGDIYIYKQAWIYLANAIGEPSLSFPSSHAVNSSAAATLVGWFFPRWKWVAGIAAFSVCFSRIYLGVHYPSDVLAGAILGVGCAFALIGLNHAAVKKFPNKLKFLTNSHQSDSAKTGPARSSDKTSA